VDDHPIVRAGIRQILAENFTAKFVEAQDCAAALQACTRHDFSLMMLDVNLPDRSGLDLLADLRGCCDETPILMLSMHEEEQFARRVLRAGASGYIRKASLASELVSAVKKVLAGGIYVSPAFAEYLAANVHEGRQEHPHEHLSDREFEVFRLIIAGKSGKEIAAQLSLSFKTISTHRTRILDKLGVTSTAGLVQYATREGLI
jgi:DNA-binding NarL/FixJ family response regulator